MNRNLFKTLVVILGIFVTFTASANYDPNDEYEVFIQDDRNQTDFVEYLVKQKLRAQELLEKIGEKPNAAMLKRLKKIRFDTEFYIEQIHLILNICTNKIELMQQLPLTNPRLLKMAQDMAKGKFDSMNYPDASTYTKYDEDNLLGYTKEDLEKFKKIKMKAYQKCMDFGTKTRAQMPYQYTIDCSEDLIYGLEEAGFFKGDNLGDQGGEEAIADYISPYVFHDLLEEIAAFHEKEQNR